MRWTSRTRELAVRGVRRFGVKAGIIVAGATIAVGTLHHGTYVAETPLAQRIVASAPADVKTPWGTTRTPDSVIAPGGLDAGVNHERIAYWVNRLSTTMAHDFERTLDRKSKYDDMIEAKLAAKHMPTDLVYLAMIESEFNPNARSPVKALGLWQFMSATARRFGLTVRGKIDERRDPERATDAAVAYLSDLHDRFGSWYLAAAAYNSGEGTVLKALKRVTGQTTGTDEDFFRILPVLPRETQDYVPKLIAAARVGDNPARYGLDVHTDSAGGEVTAAPAKKETVKPKAESKAKVKAKSKPHATSKSHKTSKKSRSHRVKR